MPPSPSPVRACHLDLKGVPPTAGRLLTLLDLAQAAGYTAVLVEWEDQFPWSEPAFRSPTCYSRAEVDAFHQRAGELGLEVIPLVQCLGHLETFLRPPAYAHLREVPSGLDVLNPLAPGAQALIAGLVEEVLAATPSLRHFHLGGDEAWSFGTHPDTAAFVARHGKAALYLQHVGPLLDRLNARQVRPILWHDMMAAWEAPALRELAARADLCVWAYNRYDRELYPWLRPQEPDEGGDGLPVLAGGCQPVCGKLLRRFQAAGVAMWGAGAFRCGRRRPVHPDLPVVPERLGNARDWQAFAEVFPMQGLVATGWARMTTNGLQVLPLDAALDALIGVGQIWAGGDPARTQAVLEKLGEAGRFHACRELMHRLAVQRDCAWENVIRCRELIASFANDPQRSGQRPAQAIGYLRNHVTQIGNLAVEAESVFAGLVPDLWIRRYCHERLEPLRRELAEIERLSAG